MKTKYSTKFIFFALVFSLLIPTNIFSQNSMEEAYKSLSEGNLEKARELFIKDAEENNNLQALICLSYLYQLEVKYDKSWETYLKVLKKSDNKIPYVLACMNKDMIEKNLEDGDFSIIELFEKLLKETNDGFFQAYLNEHIGHYYKRFAQLEKARDFFNEIDAVTKWSVIGPFENISGSGYYQEYPPEKEFVPEKVYNGKNNLEINWFDIRNIRDDKWIDFTSYFSEYNSVYYGNTFVYSNEEQKVQIRIGTSGSIKAFLNDELIIHSPEELNNDLDTYISETYLQKGWNRLLIKVGYSEISSCNFLVRITDNNGFTKQNLLYSTDKQIYNPFPGKKTFTIKSEYEKYFEEKILKDHDALGNYLLLTEIYMWNGKIYEAETILKKGLKIFPDNILLFYSLLDVYTRDNNQTEIFGTIDKIDKIKKDMIPVLALRAGYAVQNENIELAEKYLENFKDSIPDIAETHLLKAVYYLYKNDLQKASYILNEAYKKFPYSWEILNMKKNLDYTVNRSYDEAINLLETFSGMYYNLTSLYELSKIYLAVSKIDEWEKVYELIINYDPVEPENYYDMANILHSLQRYDNAEEMINKALSICPSNSAYFELLGDIQKSQDRNEEAINAYKNSLKNSTTNYDARKKLKDLTGNSPVENEIKAYDIKEIIAGSSAKEKNPNDDAVILLNDVKRVFYDGGASEYEEEILYKVLTSSAIEDLTDYWINYNSNSQDLIIDKAVVIKKDGNEIEADKQGNRLVFKSMEIDDYIYIKYKKRNYFPGKLSNHFWDSFYFNRFYPIENIRYSLVMPENIKVFYQGQNMISEPDEKRKVKNIIFYTWEKKDIPAVKYEYGMPVLDDIGMILHISTIEKWNYISDWYHDLTRSKLRENSEVKDKVVELITGFEDLSLREKAKLLYDYIIENITYSSIPFRQSAYIPQKARDVLISKIGDCKDMATLFLAMLKELGIEGNYVLVNTKDEGLNLNSLPGISFNHVIVELTFDNKKEYFDLTAKNHPFGTLPDSDVGAFALRVKKGNEKPFYINKDAFPVGKIVRDSEVNLNADNSVSVTVNTLRTGAITAGLRNIYKDKNNDERIKIFTERMSREYSNFSVNSFVTDNLNFLDNELKYTYKLTLRNYIGSAGDYKLLKIPWSDAEMPNPAVSYETRKYAYNYSPYVDVESEIMKIILPENFEPVEVPEPEKFECSTASFTINYKYENGAIIAERIKRNKKDRVNKEEYKSYKEFINKLFEEENTQILLRKK